MMASFAYGTSSSVKQMENIAYSIGNKFKLKGIYLYRCEIKYCNFDYSFPQHSRGIYFL